MTETNSNNVRALPVARRGPGAPPGNRNAARHNVYSTVLQPRELRQLDALCGELRDLLGDSYAPRFEPALTVLAGQLHRWTKVQEYLHRHGIESASSTLLRDLGTLENSMRLGMARLGLDVQSALDMRIRVERHRGDDLDLDRLTASERRTLERLVSKAKSDA